MFQILIRSFRRQHHLIFNHWEIEINEKSSQSYRFCPREHEQTSRSALKINLEVFRRQCHPFIQKGIW